MKETSERFRFSAAVALFGLILKDSEHKKHSSCDDVLALTKKAKINDESGYKAEFIRLVES